MGKKALSVALLAAGLTMGANASAASATSEMLAHTCAGCHGPDGISNGPATPSISGMSRIYFVNAMLAYKYGDDSDKAAAAAGAVKMDEGDLDALPRPATIMDRIAKGYSDEEIGLLADYFTSKPFKLAAQSANGDLASTGKGVHEENCEKCHEEGGRKGDGSGKLAGQWMPYLSNALMDFSSGDRGMPKKMRAKIKDLSDKDFEALVHYYGSQK